MIQLSEVVKEYGGVLGPRVRALDGVTLQVSAGSALGIIGPNGAGKSTLLRLLLGYLRSSGGEARIDGLDPRAYVERHGIGYLPEAVAIPPRWTVRGALEAYAALGEVDRPGERIEAELRRFELEPLAGRRVGALSKGTLQRLALAQALLGDRSLLVLDEPLNGLDPVWVVRLREILNTWTAADPRRTLLVVSHNLAELERVVDGVAVLARGRIITQLPVRSHRAATPEPGSLEEMFLQTLER